MQDNEAELLKRVFELLWSKLSLGNEVACLAQDHEVKVDGTLKIITHIINDFLLARRAFLNQCLKVQALHVW